MSSLVLLSLVVTAALTVPNDVVDAFSPPTIATLPTATNNSKRHRHAPTILFSTTTDTTPPPAAEIDDDEQYTSGGLLRRDRYVATNRFAVRPNKEAAFEKRWATRKSRLATLEGFQYFHLMRRVTLNDDGTTNTYQPGNAKEKTNLGNYVSFTIWNKKSHFSAWRSGEAFKEAHGGTSIGAFVSTLVSSALVLQGAPRPAFYDGLLLQSVKPDSVPELVDGWRSNVEADGKVTLPPECFVACNQFYVEGTENCVAFEKRWSERESTLKECDGFVAFMMMRRDLGAKGHGIVPAGSDEPTYVSTTIWRDREAFEGWRSSTNFRQAHGGGEKKKTEGKDEGGGGEKPKMPWSRPPEPVFYEGTLVITSEDGA